MTCSRAKRAANRALAAMLGAAAMGSHGEQARGSKGRSKLVWGACCGEEVPTEQGPREIRSREEGRGEGPVLHLQVFDKC